MKQEQRSFVAIALSIGVIAAWSFFFPTPKAPPPAAETATAAPATPPTETTLATAASTIPMATSTPSPIVPTTSTVDNGLMTTTWTNRGGVPTSWTLSKYTTHASTDLVNMVSPDLSTPPLALTVQTPTAIVSPDTFYTVTQPSANELVYQWMGNGLSVTKHYSFREGLYPVEMTIDIDNLTDAPQEVALSLGWSALQKLEKKGGFPAFLKGPPNLTTPIYLLDGSVSHDGPPEESMAKSGRLYWSGLEDRYFLSAIAVRSSETADLAITPHANADGSSTITATTTLPKQMLAAKSRISIPLTLYVGPKEITQLKTVGMRMDEAINYGWFTIVAVPILHLLKFFYGIVHNYGVAIILLTLFIKLLLHPINKKSMQSMKAMQKLQPKLKELREKYSDNKEKLNTEMMQLFRTNKVNPMGGCLPMLLQLPIYIALYKVLWNSIELYKAPFFWIYHDLSSPDPYFITPILLGIAMVLQQKLTPSMNADPAQQKMMMLMPIMFTAFMLFLPSGLVFYILVNTVTGVLQQWMVHRGIGFRDLLRGKWQAAV